MSSLLYKFSSLKSRRPAANARPSWQQDPIYRPLDATQDSIRLLFIHPADDPDAPIRCTVSEAKFSERPQYEALSYMWGDEAFRRPIFINDQQLQITQNLSDALHFLRLRQRDSNGSGAAGLPSLRYWIDAICINQNDVHEKNKQIRVMPHIYFRAKTVLVWLGKKQVPENLIGMRERSEKFRLHKTIYHDEYWTRLWIIQEIGKATQLQVCYVLGLTITESSSHSLEWNQLIQDVESHYTRHASDGGGQGMTEGPIRLDRQLRGKYTGSHSLLSLIETHRDARCKNPRDKIFGLVGLATDSTHDFPIDYQKSLFEVWKDTLTHLQLAGNMGPPNLVPPNLVDVALLVLESLGGPTQVLLPQTLPAKAPPSSSSALGCTPVKLRLTVLGIVMFVGPTPGDVINSLEQADLWTRSIQWGAKPAQKGSLLRENDGLLECLL
ncbi:heterokaryon incompatibility protein-domain-containing protein, partial [Parachaetomium inaequale]